MPEPIINFRDSNGNVVGTLDYDISNNEFVFTESNSSETITLDTDGLAASALNGIASDPHDNTQHSGTYIEAVGAEEDGSLVVDATDLNFTESGAATVDVTDDGDGTATIDISSTDTDTDTHTDVSDDGTLVVGDVDDINFASNLTVTDDTDNSVTVDASGGGGGVSATTARRYGLIGGI